MLVCKQTPRKNVQLVNRPSENTPSVSVSALMTLIDFTLSNARRFYSSTGNPSDTEGLTERKQDVNINESCSEWKFVKYFPSNFRAKTL